MIEINLIRNEERRKNLLKIAVVNHNIFDK